MVASGGGGEELNRQNTEDFQSSENTLYAAILIDTSHNIPVQAHRMYNRNGQTIM